MNETLTHWKKLTNPDYLGAYALEPNQDLVVTIKSVSNELVASPDGKKETCSVMSFMENVKPLVLNATNSKTITKLFKTPYIEEWAGRKIQLYVQTGVKAFGDVVDAIRVRPFLPVEKELKCADCGKKIEGTEKSTAEVLAKYSLNHYGRMLCNECGKKEHEARQQANKDKGVL
jgi:DNA-directed RNA polymerase subunit RPC12/RpoP